MKKELTALILSAALLLSVSACSQSFSAVLSGTSSDGISSDGTQKIYKIGVVQLMEHDALDNAYNGFVDGLKAAGYEDGKNIQIDYENAQNEQANCVTIASKLVNEDSDLIFAIATQAAQAAANATKDIPILVTAVTDPADAKLVQSNDKPGTNVTGTSDLTPVKEQIQLLKEMVPDVTNVGLMYCSSESNSKFQIEIAEKECDALGIRYTVKTVSSSNEVQQVAQSLVGRVQAVYVPTDNMLASGMKTLSMVFTPAKIPIVVGESGMVKNGGVATYGINYYKLGQQTAQMAVKILTGEAQPADMPIEYQEDMDAAVNEDAAKQLGITIPQDLLDKVSSAASSGN